MGEYNIGTKLTIDGEDRYNQAISLCNTTLKRLNAEMEKLDTVFKASGKSEEELTKKKGLLIEKINEQNKKIDASKTALKDAAEKYEKSAQKAESLKKEIDTLTGSTDDAEKETKEYKETLADLEDKLEKAEKKQVTNAKAVENWETKVAKAETELIKYQRELDDAEEELEELGNETEKTGKKTTDFGTILKATLTSAAIQKGLDLLVDGTKALANLSLEAGKNFEHQMSRVGAISGATGADFEALQKKAEELGANTKFTATEAAQALEYMAMAGWKTEEMLQGIDGVLGLAAASGEDLATTSDIVTDALTAMGYSAAEAGRLADVMAAASSNSNTNVSMMGETFKYAAPVVGALGYSMEDTAVAVGLMANSGIKASNAGTALRTLFTNLVKPTDKMADAMDYLNISLQNEDGSMKSLRDVMLNLREAFGQSKMSVEEYEKGIEFLNKRLADGEITQKQYNKQMEDFAEKTFTAEGALKAKYAATIAGAQGMSGLLAIVNATTTDFDKLTTAVDESNGAAARMSQQMQDNLTGAMDELESAMEGVGISAYNDFKKPLTQAVRDVTLSLNSPQMKRACSRVSESLGTAFEKIGRSLSNNLPKIVDGIGNLADGLAWLLDNGETVITLIGGIGVSVGAWKLGAAVTEMQSLTKHTGGFIELLSSNKIAIGMSAIAGGIAILKMIADASAEGREEFKQLVSEIENTSKTWELLKESSAEYIEQNSAEIYEIDRLSQKLEMLVDGNGKVIGSKTELQDVLDQLNPKLGTEYEIVNDQIKGYDNLTASIEETINAKKASVLLDAGENMYKEALIGIEESRQQLIQAKNELDNARIEAEKAEEEYLTNKTKSPAYLKAQAALIGAQEAFAKAEKNYAEHANAIDTYEKAMNENSSQNYDEAARLINKMLGDRNDSFKSACDYQEEQHAQMMEDLKKQLEDGLEMLAYALETGDKAMIEDSLSYANKAAKEFKDVGGKIPENLIEGIQSERTSAEEAIARLTKVNQASKNNAAATGKGLGQAFGEGYANGIKSMIATAQKAAASLAQKAAKSTQKTQKSNSPAKVTVKLGGDFGEGYADGIVKKIKAVQQASEKMAQSAISSTAQKLKELQTSPNFYAGTAVNNNYNMSFVQTFDGQYQPRDGAKMARDINRQLGLLYGRK